MLYTQRSFVNSDSEPRGTERFLRSLAQRPSVSRAIAFGRARWHTAAQEAAQIFGLGESWQDRLSLGRFLAKLYVARALPLETYDWDASIRLHGADYVVGLRSSEIYVIQEVFEYLMYDRLPHFVPTKDWVVFDVGANIGIVSILQAQRGAHVYAFEPNPDCFRRLTKNIRVNGLKDRIHPFQLALGDSFRTGAMRVVRGGTTGGVFVADDDQAEEKSSSLVIMTTLDRIVPTDLSHIDLLKIDVEGAEIQVLRGAQHVLRMTQRVILEFHSRRLLLEAQDILAASGFTTELKVDYYPEDSASAQEEVGLLYVARPQSPSVNPEVRAGASSLMVGGDAMDVPPSTTHSAMVKDPLWGEPMAAIEVGEVA